MQKFYQLNAFLAAGLTFYASQRLFTRLSNLGINFDNRIRYINKKNSNYFYTGLFATITLVGALGMFSGYSRLQNSIKNNDVLETFFVSYLMFNYSYVAHIFGYSAIKMALGCTNIHFHYQVQQ